MKKILTLLTIALTTLSFAGSAQVTGGKVTGKVIDGNTKTIEAASITLHKASDSTVAKMSVANKEGNYQFENVTEGNYFVSISAVGHSKGFSEKFTVDAAHAAIEVKTIELVPVSKNLGAVTVTSRKPLIEQRIDRTIVNVEAAVTNVGATALEVLEKSPGISVDKDGNVSLCTGLY
jgi:iron complex outermembrane recepter protein